MAAEHHVRYIHSAAKSAGEDLLIALRFRHLEKERVQRKREALRRETGPLIAGRAHPLEGVDEDLLLIGDKSVKTQSQAPPFLKRRRFGDGVPERPRRGVDEAVFDPEISGEDAIVDGVRRNFAKEAVAKDRSPCSIRMRAHALRERRLVAHDAFLARATNCLARSRSTGFHQSPSTFNELATMTPSTMERMSLTLARINAAADERRKRSGRPNLPEIIKIGGVAGALAGEDHDVGVEKLDVAHKFGDRPILHDGVRAVLDVSVGENLDALRLERAPIAHGFRSGPFDQALIGDIGVGPLIDAHEARARRARNRQSVERGVGQHVNPNRQSGFAPGRDRLRSPYAPQFPGRCPRASKMECRRGFRQ